MMTLLLSKIRLKGGLQYVLGVSLPLCVKVCTLVQGAANSARDNQARPKLVPNDELFLFLSCVAAGLHEKTSSTIFEEQEQEGASS